MALLPVSYGVPREAVKAIDRGLFLVHPFVELARPRVVSFELLHAALPPHHLSHLVERHARKGLCGVSDGKGEPAQG